MFSIHGDAYKAFQSMPLQPLPSKSPTSNQRQPLQNRDYQSLGMNDRKRQAMYYWKLRKNWDHFLEKILQFTVFPVCLIIRTLAFMICFSTFLIGCIDHANISKKRQLSEAIVPDCLYHLNVFHKLTLVVFSCFWVYELFKLIQSLPELKNIYFFYTELLEIPDTQMDTITWHQITQKLVHLYHETKNTSQYLPKRLNAHDIANRIMRRENYLIALFNKEVLDLRVPIWGKQILTKVLEWNLSFCILEFVFGWHEEGEYGVKKSFLRDVDKERLVNGLRKRLYLMAILNLILSPFIFFFLLLYFFFKYGEEFHKNPTQLGSRTYSPLARWKIRDFNELPHLFQARLNASYPTAMRFLNQFPKYKMAIVAQFISLVAGSIGLSLTFLSVLDDDILLNFHITQGRSVLWYLGVFGVIYTSARSMIPDPHLVLDAENLFKEVVRETRYLPADWKRKGLGTEYVRDRFSELFEYRLVLFFEELMSVFLCPFVLLISLPPCVPKLVDFFREYSVHVEGVGYVSSFSVFDFRKFNQDRGLQQPQIQKDETIWTEEKMEQSAVHFKKQNPEWEPADVQSSMFIKKLVKKEEEFERLNFKRHLKTLENWSQNQPLSLTEFLISNQTTPKREKGKLKKSFIVNEEVSEAELEEEESTSQEPTPLSPQIPKLDPNPVADSESEEIDSSSSNLSPQLPNQDPVFAFYNKS